jgi:plasmid stabilization system protein ParE
LTRYRIIVELPAEHDLESAVAWYEQERQGLGLALAREVRSTNDRIIGSPHWYQVVALGVRRALVRRFPYAVYYVIEADVISVIAVTHTSRNPGEWQRRRSDS